MATILEALAKLPVAEHYYIGYSGGLDSTVLLEAISKIHSNVTAVHINDGLSPNANYWMEHAEEFSAKLNIPLITSLVKVANIAKESPEEAARIARYEVFEKILTDNTALVLAHHELDQAETILMRLFRGTGPLGLGGMQEQSKLGAGLLLRPFLGITKEELIAYAIEHNLSYVEDETNYNNCFTRNYLRNEIFPLLQTKWPRVVKSINRAGNLCFETATALQLLAAEDWERVKTSTELNINIAMLKKLEYSRRLGVIRYWLQLRKVQMPSYDHLLRIEREVVQAEEGKNPQLKIDTYTVERQGLCLLLKFH